VKAKKTKKKSQNSHRKTDRRIVRTRDTLGDALVALMHEKKFDEITVQDLLDRAGVGRSTFYAHYRDKQDLFLSDVEDFFESFSKSLARQGASTKRVLPVKELFTHIREVREFYSAVVTSGMMNDVQMLGRGFFARSIDLPPGPSHPRRALVYFKTGLYRDALHEPPWTMYVDEYRKDQCDTDGCR
jgi:AcrR family transcriptional regulator